MPSAWADVNESARELGPGLVRTLTDPGYRPLRRRKRNEFAVNDFPAGSPAITVTASGEPDPEDIWRAPADRLLAQLATQTSGLHAADARSRVKTYGPNDASAVKRSPLWLQFLARFRNPLVIILLVASALSAATGDVPSFVIIITIVTLSIIFDFVQEVRAQNAVEALRRSVAVQATVRRSGASISVPTEQLVPGDVGVDRHPGRIRLRQSGGDRRSAAAKPVD
jgi:Mg2+-importing ATPase